MTPDFPDVRWQCRIGHFISQADIRTEDHRDDGEYYGVSTSWEYDCRYCGKTYRDRPRLVLLRRGDVDEIAVERALAGDRVRLNRAERRRVVEVLTERGYSGRHIAELLRISRREVVRYRARLRESRVSWQSDGVAA